MKQVLFVCSANIDRSKTAEDFFSENIGSIEFNSAGTNRTICNEKGTNFLSQSDVDLADIILTMEAKHRNWIYKNLEVKGIKIEVLGIKDVYLYYDTELIEILKKKCGQHLQFDQ